jgi:hypothetical protein
LMQELLIDDPKEVIDDADPAMLVQELLVYPTNSAPLHIDVIKEFFLCSRIIIK